MAEIRRNIELKARLSDLAAARATALRLTNGPPEIQRQTDTYFYCPRGRLKLREIAGQIAQLIGYVREDAVQPTGGDYQLVAVSQPDELKAVLADTLGVDVVVSKLRESSMYRNVRIHLDEVVGLGCFLEFEAQIQAGLDDNHCFRQLADLSVRFNLRGTDLVATSYSDQLRP